MRQSVKSKLGADKMDHGVSTWRVVFWIMSLFGTFFLVYSGHDSVQDLGRGVSMSLVLLPRKGAKLGWTLLC